jgi:replication initiation protein RepC
MYNEHVTTPFGRRPITLALVKGQLEATSIPREKSVDKWKVFRDACDARAMLGLRDRALAVLNALLSFHPETELSGEDNLVVFPSNLQLSARANGIAGTTLRENLALLVKAGLLHRRDSPNGKRFARKGQGGTIEQAYGFSLAPLLARSEELAQMAQEVVAERRRLQVTKEKITILRRDIRKLITAAIEEGSDGDWPAIEAEYIGMIAGLSRARSLADHESMRDKLGQLYADIVKQLEIHLISSKTDGNDSDCRHHIQNSNTDSHPESEPLRKKEQAAISNAIAEAGERTGAGQGLKPIPLAMLLRACPEISMYGPGGAVTNWRDLMTAAVVVRSMLGISPSAYQEACEVMGPENAAAVVACILERAGHITSPGGYLRGLTMRARNEVFSLGPMVMALLRASTPGRNTG